MIIAKLKLLTELPKTCAYCRFKLLTIRSIYCELVRDRVGDILKEREGDITKRPEWCPWIEVADDNEESRYCDRNICMSNEYNGKECDEIEVTKHNEKMKEVKG